MLANKKKNINYSEVLHYMFNSLPVFEHSGGSAYKPGLQTIGELDDFYNSPHKQFKTIHIAGTNGKGSVSHMLAAIMQGSGYKTGLFTSPHLIDFRERIRINGQMITQDEVVEFVTRSRELFDKVKPSFFEMTVAMAFDHFARHQVDIAIIETGMGGRLDATNIINPVMSVITNISMDHAQFLGNNAISIATEKAGIIKQGVPLVIGETQPGVALVFEKEAKKKQSPIVFADQHAKISRHKYTADGQAFYLEQEGKELPVPVAIDLCGEYQRKNIITTLIALQHLRHLTNITVDTNTVLPSLLTAARSTGLRGRWQQLRENPLIICDVAHNQAAWAWIVEQFKRCKFRKLHIIIGFANDKDILSMLEMMPRDAVYYFTKADNPRALSETELEKAAAKYELTGKAYPNVNDAIDAAMQIADKDDMIYIGGSTFVVAQSIEILLPVKEKH